MSFRNTLLVLLFGGTLSMALLREQPRGTLEPFDRVHREFLKANPGEGREAAAPGNPSIVFARLDDGDLPRPVFEAWPLNESDWQGVLQNIPGYGPKVTALSTDLGFVKAGPPLEAAAKAVPSLCVSALLSASPGDGAGSLPDTLPVLKVNGSITAIPEFKAARHAPLPGLTAAGRIDMLPREQSVTLDGNWCRVPMVARMADKVVPTLALRALLAWADVPLEEVMVTPGVSIAAGKAFRIEIDDAGAFRFFLEFAPRVPAVNADAFTFTRDQSAVHLPDDREDKAVLLKNLKGGLLWIGLNDVKSRTLNDPDGTPVSPADLTARAIAVIQTRTHLLPLAANMQWITPAVTLLFCVWLTHWRKSRLWPGALAAFIALISVSLWFYRRDHLWLPLGPSLALVLLTLVLSYLLPAPKPKYAGESGTRRTMRTGRSTRGTTSRGTRGTRPSRSASTTTRPSVKETSPRAGEPRDETARDPVPHPGVEALPGAYTQDISEPATERDAHEPDAGPASNLMTVELVPRAERVLETTEERIEEAAPDEGADAEADTDPDSDGDEEDDAEQNEHPGTSQQIARPQRQGKKKKKRRR